MNSCFPVVYKSLLNSVFFKDLFIYLFSERGERRRRRETLMCEKHQLVASRVPPKGNLAPCARHVLWQGIEPVTSWFTGWCSFHWATPARAELSFFDVQIVPELASVSPFELTLVSMYCFPNVFWERFFAFWHNEVFQASIVPTLPQPWNHAFFWGAQVPSGRKRSALSGAWFQWSSGLCDALGQGFGNCQLLGRWILDQVEMLG